MVREIIHVQVGQCGNQIGNIFWNTICHEHHIKADGLFEKNKKYLKIHDKNKNNANKNTNPNPNPLYDSILLDKINVYFNETNKKTLRYTPRAVLVDLEPGTLDKIKADAIGGIFAPDNFVFGASGCSNNWAKGRFTEGLEVIDEILDIVRRETENADCPQAYQLTHSLGGGTGSGLGTLILNRIRDTYFSRITAAFSVYPSPTMSDVVVEPYNALLSVSELCECADQSYTLDNEALIRILKENNVSTSAANGFGQYNELISYVMSGITSSLRFPGQLNGDLRKMGVNLVPFPRLHFFVVSQSPLLSINNQTSSYTKLTTQELTSRVLDHRSYYVNLDPDDGKFLTASIIYRGDKNDISTFEVDKEIAGVKYQAKYYGQFVSWIPNNFKYSLINIPAKGYDSNTKNIVNIPMSSTFISNHTAIRNVFQSFLKKYKKLYSKKAFIHWYFDEGMDEDNFNEASHKIDDLITEYQERGDAVVDFDNPDGIDFDSDNDIDSDIDDDAILAKYSSKKNVDVDNDANDDDNDDNVVDDNADDNDDDNDDADGSPDPWD